MAPPVLLAVYYGSPAFGIMAALFAVAMGWEWQHICRGRFGAAGVAICVGGGAAGILAATWPLAALAVSVTAAVVAALIAPRGADRPSPLWEAAGALYVAVPVAALVWLREAAGVPTLVWLFLVVWATDIGGYAAGKTIGGPLLAPAISPKKTWAGAGGGMVLALAVGVLVAQWLAVPVGPLLWASAAVSVVSQIGDLAESKVKRRFGVKDSGAIIPGHGGVLDRVDGLLAAAPVVAAAVLIGWG